MARPRPQDMSEAQLGFQPQKAVRWLAPRTLITTGAQSLVAEIFGSYADKRELQGSLPAIVHDHSAHDELWLDYVADLGDGFDATYSVASLLAAPRLDLGERTPRGQLLVMGGDEVYPAASTSGYEDRSKGVYRAAMPVSPPDAPTLFALPGNHDWYDGLTSFLRVFAQRRPFGGWRTEQTRSYFAVKLPHRWWLYAIDTQFDDYVDAPQLEYFRAASEDLQSGDAVILCTSTPAWVSAGSGGETKGYDTVEFFQREIIRPRGATVRVMLSGDKHHYSRYAERAGTGQKITSGLGGAYLAATDRLPKELTLPPAKSRVREPANPTRFGLAARYPAHTDRLAAGIFRLPWRNPGFWGLTGTTQLVATMAMLYGLAESAVRSGVFGLLASWSPAVVVAAVLVLAGITFARLDLPGTDRRHLVAGALHAVGHLALSVGWALVIRWLYHDVLPAGAAGDWLVFLIAAVGTPVLIGFLDAEVVALYLLVASRFGINLNEVMAGQSIEDHKGFLRMRIAGDGTLTIYPVKIDRICREWRANPDGAAADPWFLPRAAADRRADRTPDPGPANALNTSGTLSPMQDSPHYTDEEDRRYIGDRLIYFSDAVVAIAMTLLALELPVPRGETNAEVWRSFVHLLHGEYLNFLISFAVIGVFWIAHNQYFRKIHAVDPALRWLNLAWLFLIVLVPFATKVNSADGDFVLGPVLYAVVITLIAAVMMLMARHAVRGGLLRPGTPPHPMRELLLGAGAATVGFVVSIPVAFFSPSWSRNCWILILVVRIVARRVLVWKEGRGGRGRG